jgi:hypothetical protein
MTQALVTLNAVPGSNTDLPIAVLVQLNNTGNGGEITYAWSILDQPVGTADALSSLTIQNPTFTPNKEGSYLIQLVVNASLADEQIKRVVAAVKQLKTRTRVPAAGETTEADAADGYAADANVSLRLLDTMRADPGIMVAQLGYGAVVNEIVYFQGTATIKSGLPGQEFVPIVLLAALATPTDVATAELGAVLGAVDGGALTSGKLAYIRTFGLMRNIPVTAAALGSVYLAALGAFTMTAGRRVGRVTVVVSANVADVMFNGII